MWIQKLRNLNITCPHCGSKMVISNDEYLKYRKETEDYCGSTILCQKYDDKGKRVGDITYTNMDCPVCKRYIPITVSDNCDSCDSDMYGFCYSNCVKPEYGTLNELTIDDYLKDFFGEEDEMGELSDVGESES